MTPKGNKDSSISEIAACLSLANCATHHRAALLNKPSDYWRLISDTFPHVQLLFFPSKRTLGKWKVRRHLNKYFLPHTVCLAACAIPKWIGSTSQRLSRVHSLAGDLVRNAKEQAIAVSGLSPSDAASQSRISRAAGQHSFQLFCPPRKGFLPVKRLSPASVCSDRVSKGTWA